MESWNVTIRIERDRTMVLVTEPCGDVLRARLPTRSEHPRALLTLLEGLALWSGQVPICAAISVAAAVPPFVVGELLGGEFWPQESPLVRLAFVEPRGRRRRLGGVGDFRLLYRVVVDAS